MGLFDKLRALGMQEAARRERRTADTLGDLKHAPAASRRRYADQLDRRAAQLRGRKGGA